METEIEKVSELVPEESEFSTEQPQEVVAELEDAAELKDTDGVQDSVEPVYYPEYQFESPWTLICGAQKEFETTKSQGFLKGCKWSPDGTCLLTCSDDGLLRLFDLPADMYKSHKTTFQGCSTTQLSPSLKIKESETVYDYCWHPLMSSWNPDTCLYVLALITCYFNQHAKQFNYNAA